MTLLQDYTKPETSVSLLCIGWPWPLLTGAFLWEAGQRPLSPETLNRMQGRA